MAALRIGVLAHPGCFASEVYGVPDLLTMASRVARGSGEAGYAVSVVSPRRRVVASGGTPIAVSGDLDVDVLVVPGFEAPDVAGLREHVTTLGPEADVVSAHAAAGRAVVSICVGAFVLAEAGVLAGRRATTSWLFADELARRCPDADVVPAELVVTDAGVTTTGAFSAMYDFALGLIAEHDGPRVARATARIALLDGARTSQAPYVDTALLPRPGETFSDRVIRHLEQTLAEPYDLARLADALHVSTRTLLRRVAAETGQSPLQHLQTARVQRARHLLETTDRTVAEVARTVGYRDPGGFASVFARSTGLRPRDYRATFGRGWQT